MISTLSASRFPVSTARRRWLAGAVSALSFLAFAPAAQAAPVDDAVAELQHDWEVIRYQAPAGERHVAYQRE